MTRPRPTRTVALLLAVAAACGGGDDAGGDASSDPVDAESGVPPTVPTVGDVVEDLVDEAPEPVGESSAPVPIVRFAAHGPDAENTVGPACGVGILNSGGDIFRLTPPAGWSWVGTSGGSGSDEVAVADPDGVRISVILAKSAEEKNFLSGWEVVGPAGVDLDLGGEPFPMTEVVVEGTAGYAIVDLPYVGPLPLLSTEGQLGTVVVTSDTEGRPTTDEAVAILESVRVERCAAISEAIVWAAADGFAPVPRFEPDPLGKTWPEQPQPAIAGLVTLEAYSLEQLAYLMPVEQERAVCAAEAALAAYAGDPLGYLKVLVASGTQQAELDAVIAGC